MDEYTGVIDWVPTPDQAGIYELEFEFAGAGGAAVQKMRILVECEGYTTGCACDSGGRSSSAALTLLLLSFAVRARRAQKRERLPQDAL
jgi:hypothetical protein